MSVCSPCTRLNRISKCTDAIVVGTMPAALTDYTVYFENLATDKIVFFTGTSDAAALLTITPTNGFFFTEGQDYEVWATLTNDPIESQVEILPDNVAPYAAAITCMTISFVRVYDSDNSVNKNFTSQTFSV